MPWRRVSVPCCGGDVQQSADMHIEDDGTFEIILSARKHPGNWLPMTAETGTLVVRQTFLDRESEQPTNTWPNTRRMKACESWSLTKTRKLDSHGGSPERDDVLSLVADRCTRPVQHPGGEIGRTLSRTYTDPQPDSSHQARLYIRCLQNRALQLHPADGRQSAPFRISR